MGDEFCCLLRKPAAAQALTGIGIDVVGLVDHLDDYLFEAGESLCFVDFVDSVLALRGSNRATVTDIVNLRKMIMQGFMDFVDQMPELVQKGLRQDGPAAD